MKRRDFLRSSIAGAATIGLSSMLFRSCALSDSLHDFGIISGVVSNELEVDARDTLRKLADMGYKYLEGGGTYGMTPPEFKSFLQDIGLKAIAGGSNMAAFQGDGLQKLIDAQLELDKKYLVCYWPWTKAPEEYTLEDLEPIVDEFHRIGEACAKHGLRFAYHNHDHEFTVAAEGKAYDYFLEKTDPELVCMQMDIYWVSVGGADPVHYIEKYPGRFELLHVKDAYDLSNRESFACVGEGLIDFERIFKLRETGGFKYLIVEKDGAVNGIECAQTSINHLNSLKF